MTHKPASNSTGPVRFNPFSSRAVILSALCGALLTANANPIPPHNIVAANVEADLSLGLLVVTAPYTVGDFRIRDTYNPGDYDIQIGDTAADDVSGGVIISSVRQNGRDNFNPLYPGTNYVTSHLGVSDTTPESGYWIPVQMTLPNSVATTIVEYDCNVAAGWFPYDKWIAGYARYEPRNKNNTTLDVLDGSPGLVMGTHFIDVGGAVYVVDLTSIGIDSRTDGVLLVLGAKNDDNYADSQVNTTNGTWTVWSKDNGNPAGEQDPIAFVFVPKTNTTVVSGRFLANANIDAFSGSSPAFTVTSVGTGEWELKLNDFSPANGVLLISPEGGRTDNFDNIVSYQLNAAGDGWIIQARDIPAVAQPDLSYLCPLETPADLTEPIASFIFIPGATPGFSVTPFENLQTSEFGGTADFTVVLDTAPTADVTIAVSSSDPSEGMPSVSSLTFTPFDWNIPQMVTVTGVDDALEDGPVAYSIVLAAAVSADPAYNGIDPVDVSLLNADSEPGITVNPVGGLVTTEAGGTATFTVQLNTQPTADVSIGLTSSDTSEGTLTQTTLTFGIGNWNSPQTVTVTGVDDPVDDGDILYTIVTAAATSADGNYNGKNPLDVEVTNTDNDTAAIHVTPDALSIVEGNNANYTVVLGSQPAADVVVTVTSGDPVNGPASPATLTFTGGNWSTPQSVTVTATDDLIADGTVFCTVTNTAASTDPLYTPIDPIDVNVTLLDNEPVLTLNSEGAIYGSGMPAIAVATLAGLLDPNTPNYNNGQLTVAISANGSSDDRLAIRNDGNAAGQIGVSGSTVSYGGTPIGTFSGGTGTAPLMVALNSAATPASVEALIRVVTFANVNASPSTAPRTLTYTVEHADGGTAAASTAVRVGLLRVAEFQEGVDRGYGAFSGTADIELFEGQPDTPWPAGHNGNALWMDARSAGNFDNAQVLLRFDDFIGNGPGQVPSNSTIVLAELIVTVPPEVSNAQGDASPLYRMLVPWDAEFSTYNSVGFGFQGFTPDDFHARATYDSFLGLANGDANTGTGTISLGVTEDVKAWVNTGATNYGWLMNGWESRTDGTAIAASEDPNPLYRPHLRVLWLPADTAVATFRQNVNGYTNAFDTRIRANEPDTDFSTLASVYVDYQVAGGIGQNDEQVLLRFENVVGSDPGQVPTGSRIEAAILDLASMVGNAMGDGGQIYAMKKSWADTDTWNTLIDGITADGVEAASTPTAVAGNASRAPNVQAAFNSFEMTSDVHSWVNGGQPNYGWAFLPWENGGDGWGFGTSEQSEERYRPQLRVFYTPGVITLPATMLTPVVAPGSVQVRFNGQANTQYSVERTTALPGGWTVLTTVTTDGSGLGTYTDNTPPAGGAFYRVFTP